MTITYSRASLDDIIDRAKTTCVVIGYAARDAESVQQHIDELAAIGVAPPPEVPMIYPMPTELVTTAATFAASTDSSGEVEPVLVRSGGRLYLGVGSDHTDRKLEVEDILRSKLACPKPVGEEFVEIDPTTFDWDACEIRSTVDGREYQRGHLNELRTPGDLLGLLAVRSIAAEDVDVVVFGGTVPLIGGEFVYGRTWTISLTLPDGRALEHTYEIKEED